MDGWVCGWMEVKAVKIKWIDILKDRQIYWTGLIKNYKIIKFTYFCERIAITFIISLDNFLIDNPKMAPIFKIQAAFSIKIKFLWGSTQLRNIKFWLFQKVEKSEYSWK